ncbi:hypothetical protein BKA62DRAFT_802469 [Auriculariales sp. MPI-PUGE-AT-0066]|nr:hypothetical protein BKA62DRAFT_802469 [Auriculariales sp. MPI-PUGE-AT-0066]
MSTDNQLRPLALLPFILSSINSRWRQISLAMPRLWSHIFCPDILGQAWTHAHLERNPYTTHAVQTTGLHIQLRNGRLNRWEASDSIQITEAVLQALSEHSDRWETVKLVRITRESIMRALRYPTPALHDLVINSPSLRWNDATSPYLPRLRHLEIVSGEFVCANADTISDLATVPCPMLTNLKIHYDYAFGPAWEIVRACAGTLRWLWLNLQPEFAPAPEPRRPLLESASNSLTTLYLFDKMGGQTFEMFHFECLSVLKNLDRVSFTSDEVYYDGWTVATGVLIALAERVPPIWPRLEALIVDDALLTSDEPPSLGEELLLFVKSRSSTTLSAEITTAERPSALRYVSVQYCPACALAERDPSDPCTLSSLPINPLQAIVGTMAMCVFKHYHAVLAARDYEQKIHHTGRETYLREEAKVFSKVGAAIEQRRADQGRPTSEGKDEPGIVEWFSAAWPVHVTLSQVTDD